MLHHWHPTNPHRTSTRQTLEDHALQNFAAAAPAAPVRPVRLRHARGSACTEFVEEPEPYSKHVLHPLAPYQLTPHQYKATARGSRSTEFVDLRTTKLLSSSRDFVSATVLQNSTPSFTVLSQIKPRAPLVHGNLTTPLCTEPAPTNSVPNYQSLKLVA